jgi:hypothetical protein
MRMISRQERWLKRQDGTMLLVEPGDAGNATEGRFADHQFLVKMEFDKSPGDIFEVEFWTLADEEPCQQPAEQATLF